MYIYRIEVKNSKGLFNLTESIESPAKFIELLNSNHFFDDERITELKFYLNDKLIHSCSIKKPYTIFRYRIKVSRRFLPFHIYEETSTDLELLRKLMYAKYSELRSNYSKGLTRYTDIKCEMTKETFIDTKLSEMEHLEFTDTRNKIEEKGTHYDKSV